ncbi:MAG: hypothetical protein K2M77_10300 [Muribaculaceae bacterium]|nr:hypothetical protein [Muribaculaceae bacterium]
MVDFRTIRILTLSAFLSLTEFGCQNRDEKLLNALEMAEDNRSELESVINHYTDNPEKLAASKFLIDNMPGHYSLLTRLCCGDIISGQIHLLRQIRIFQYLISVILLMKLPG